jgi:hypothetical protein
MSTNLYKVSPSSWAVKGKKDKLVAFDTIEEAATHLESIGVPDEEIDLALVEMAARNHSRAEFGALEGRFIFSDVEKVDELFGNS